MLTLKYIITLTYEIHSFIQESSFTIHYNEEYIMNPQWTYYFVKLTLINDGVGQQQHLFRKSITC